MRDRLEQVLKIACVVLAALFVVRLAIIVIHSNPLARVRIPDLPTLSPDTNAPSAVKRTNLPPPQQLAKNETNASSHITHGTNAVSSASNAIEQATKGNSAQHTGTNHISTGNLAATIATNPALRAALARGESNAVTPHIVAMTGTNAGVRVGSGTAGSNSAAGSNLSTMRSTQILASARGPGARPGFAMIGPGGLPGGMPARAPELSPEAKARVFRIYDSELLGPVMHPLPMALLGIAGNFAFLRAPSGQTGMVKEGDTVGEIKLLKIGINRVLVEEAGEKKELKIFEGSGGESLLPKP